MSCQLQTKKNSFALPIWFLFCVVTVAQYQTLESRKSERENLVHI